MNSTLAYFDCDSDFFVNETQKPDKSGCTCHFYPEIKVHPTPNLGKPCPDPKTKDCPCTGQGEIWGMQPGLFYSVLIGVIAAFLTVSVIIVLICFRRMKRVDESKTRSSKAKQAAPPPTGAGSVVKVEIESGSHKRKSKKSVEPSPTLDESTTPVTTTEVIKFLPGGKHEVTKTVSFGKKSKRAVSPGEVKIEIMI